jgi:phospholipid transport system substrate-binding protein
MDRIRPVVGPCGRWVRTIGLLVLVLLPAAVGPAPAQAATDPEAARAFMTALADKAIQALTPPEISQEEREARARALLRDNFAVETIGQFVLGRHWRAATPEERAEYLKLFEDMIVTTYVDRFKRYTGQKLLIAGTTTDAETGDVFVTTEIERAGSTPVSLGWRVRDENGQLKIVDVIVEGVSMSQAQRSEFSSVIRNTGGSIQGLLTEMRKRVQGGAG